MPGTATTRLGLYCPADGDTGWGGSVDANWNRLDKAIVPTFTGGAATAGTATMGEGGAVTVPTTAITTASIVLATPCSGADTTYEEKVDRVPGTSFKLRSTNGGEDFDVGWFIVNP